MSSPWIRTTSLSSAVAFGEDLQVVRLLDYANHTDVHDVPDPYYSDNFDHVYRLVDDGCRGLLAHIRQEQGLVVSSNSASAVSLSCVIAFNPTFFSIQ